MILHTQIEFRLFGLELVEPNVLVTDLLLGSLCILLGYRLSKLNTQHIFFRNWKRFLYLFGLGAIMGGFGHAFINYTGLTGKLPSWLLAMAGIYFVEVSMISIYPGSRGYKILSHMAVSKLILTFLTLAIILIRFEPGKKTELGFLVVMIYSLVGMILTTGIMGFYYFRLGFSRHFLRLITGVLIMMPSVFVFLLELNPLPWFDKNDLSHVLLGIGITFFYAGIYRMHKHDFQHFSIKDNLLERNTNET